MDELDDEVREEFQILHGYSEELKRVLVMKVLLAVYRLLEIADHKTLCDHLANKTIAEKTILSTLDYYWEKCAEQWVKNRLDRGKTFQSVQSQTSNKLEKEITENDKRFLRSLWIAADVLEPPENDDDGA